VTKPPGDPLEQFFMWLLVAIFVGGMILAAIVAWWSG
jgi:hypothetical protein